MKQITHRVFGASALLVLSLLAPAALDARKVQMDVSWTDAGSKPERVELQGHDFGSKEFQLLTNKYSLEHDFPNLGRPANIVLVYNNVSAVVRVRPYGSASVIPIRLTIKPNQYCDVAVIERLELNVQSGDYNRLLSSAIQSQLILATGTCDTKFANRLNKVGVATRCNLASMLDFFDIGGGGFTTTVASQLNPCRTSYAAALVKSFKSNLERAIKTGDTTAAMQLSADISALLGDEELTDSLAETPSLLEGLKSVQSHFIVGQFIKSQSAGDFINADLFREQVTLFRSDPDYDKALAKYSSATLDTLLREVAVVENAVEVAPDSGVIDAKEPSATDEAAPKENNPEH